MPTRLTIDQTIDVIRDSLEDMSDADALVDLLRIVRGDKARVIHPEDDDASEGQKEILIETDGD